jgi:peptidoglycan hydrolase CwlO-like protein
MYHAYYVQNSILSALAQEKENSKQKEIEVQLQQMQIKLKELEERVESLMTQVKTHDGHCHDTFSFKK